MTVVADLIVLLLVLAHTHLCVISAHLIVQDQIETFSATKFKREILIREFYEALTYRMWVSIFAPPGMLLCIVLLNYINNSFQRNKIKAKVGKVFITAQFAFAFYVVLYSKNKGFINTFENLYGLRRADINFQITIFEQLVQYEKIISILIWLRLFLIDYPIFRSVSAMQNRIKRALSTNL